MSSSSMKQTPAHQRTWTILVAVATGVNLLVYLFGTDLSYPGCSQVAKQVANTGKQKRELQRAQGLGQTNDDPNHGATTKSITEALPVSTQSPAVTDECQLEYNRVTANRTDGLTEELFQRANSYHGNRYRLAKLGETLHDFHKHPRPLNMVVSGGSVTMGHGVLPHLRYSNRLEEWLNQNYPMPPHLNQKHNVFNKASHGADICAMAKRLDMLISDLPQDIDLYVLEFAVNDYQGQDHKMHLNWRMDVFFDGFQDIALCTETVVSKLLQAYPQATILFLEMRSAIVQRKTASLIHLGVAQHYQVPVISYDQALFPEYQRLLQILKPFNFSTVPGDSVLPYPHGCHPCISEHIVDYFKPNGCVDLCSMQRFAGLALDCTLQPGRVPCTVSMWSHDEVHPSGIGHQIVTDLLIDKIASMTLDICQRKQGQFERAAVFPSNGWMVSDPGLLNAQSAFLMVNDTYEFFVERRLLTPANQTDGFFWYVDFFGRNGWQATNEAGGESISFNIKLPEGECYVPYLAALKSYEGMGTFQVTVLDQATSQEKTVEVDGLWAPRISVPSDIQLLADKEDNPGCTGNCLVTVKTNPLQPGRTGNKVKLITLSVRKCIQ